MKRWVSLLLSTLLFVSLCACTPDAPVVNVTTTTTATDSTDKMPSEQQPSSTTAVPPTDRGTTSGSKVSGQPTFPPPGTTLAPTGTTTKPSSADPGTVSPVTTKPLSQGTTTQRISNEEPADQPSEENKVIYDSNGVAYWPLDDGTLAVYGCANGSRHYTKSALVIPSQVNGKQVSTVDVSAFSGNTAITSLIVGEGVTSVGSGAFTRCTNLKTVTLPSTLKRLEGNAFSECRSLTSISLPNGLTYIGNAVFKNTPCTLTIPKSVTEIGDYAFNNTALTELYIPGNVKLGTNLFRDCKSLKKVTLGEGLTAIPKTMFKNCSALTEVVIPATVISYGSQAFMGCTALTIDRLTVRGTVDSGAFTGGPQLGTVDVYTNLPASAFSSTRINTITLHEGVTIIDESTFSHAWIGKINLPSTLTAVESAFYGCYVDSLVFTGAVTLRQSALKGCHMKTVTLPKGSFVGKYAFTGCDKLETIRFGGTIAEWQKMISIPNYGYTSSDFTEVKAATVICSDGTIEGTTK